MFLHQKVRTSASEETPSPCPHWTNPLLPDCGRLLWTVPYAKLSKMLRNLRHICSQLALFCVVSQNSLEFHVESTCRVFYCTALWHLRTLLVLNVTQLLKIKISIFDGTVIKTYIFCSSGIFSMLKKRNNDYVK